MDALEGYERKRDRNGDSGRAAIHLLEDMFNFSSLLSPGCSLAQQEEALTDFHPKSPHSLMGKVEEAAAFQEILPAPFISVHPASRRVTLGGNATIFCRTPVLALDSALPSRHFHLEKEGPQEIMSADAHHGMASFCITNVGRENGGTFNCCSLRDGAQSCRSESLELL
ncbi:hypothetical protein lerEdw1_020758 [Lerista edwardsae]|nr:hypothetical protein lerEdw1_020758 [Lerista edwardsae]